MDCITPRDTPKSGKSLFKDTEFFAENVDYLWATIISGLFPIKCNKLQPF
jgi:hypothetical protein